MRNANGFCLRKARLCLGVGEELKVQKEKESSHNKGSVARVWVFEKSRTYYNGCVARQSGQLK